LLAILHNLYVDGMRRVAREGAAIQLPELAHLEPAFAYPPHQVASLRLRDLERALAKLPEEQRSVVILVGVQGKEYRTVATLLDLPVGTVRSRLSRGRNALRKLTDVTAAPRRRRLPRRVRRPPDTGQGATDGTRARPNTRR
jgi:RNA polymerase sigma-70 factor, ECF subfamily